MTIINTGVMHSHQSMSRQSLTCSKIDDSVDDSFRGRIACEGLTDTLSDRQTLTQTDARGGSSVQPSENTNQYSQSKHVSQTDLQSTKNRVARLNTIILSNNKDLF